MHKKPTEFAINMNLDKMMILQQSELPFVSDLQYFDENSPCHLYFIGKRPRVIVDKDSFKLNDESFQLTFRIQKKDKWDDLTLNFENKFESKNVRFESEYPYNVFKLYDNDKLVLTAKVSVFLQAFVGYPHNIDFLDFEVLYIGQSYGVEGARTAPDRLINHSTLQGIYAEAISKNPDSEIWIALASFSQVNIMMFDGRTKFTEEEREMDKDRFINIFDKINYQGINEQQKINFTEAALIKYFKPPYNKIYKDSFPNPAHSTYQECYDLDINSICIELQTSEIVNCKFFSELIPKKLVHMKDFALHSQEDRISMFNFSK